MMMETGSGVQSRCVAMLWSHLLDMESAGKMKRGAHRVTCAGKSSKYFGPLMDVYAYVDRVMGPGNQRSKMLVQEWVAECFIENNKPCIGKITGNLECIRESLFYIDVIFGAEWSAMKMMAQGMYGDIVKNDVHWAMAGVREKIRLVLESLHGESPPAVGECESKAQQGACEKGVWSFKLLDESLVCCDGDEIVDAEPVERWIREMTEGGDGDESPHGVKWGILNEVSDCTPATSSNDTTASPTTSGASSCCGDFIDGWGTVASPSPPVVAPKAVRVVPGGDWRAGKGAAEVNGWGRRPGTGPYSSFNTSRGSAFKARAAKA